MKATTSRGYLYLILKDQGIEIGYGCEGELLFSADFEADDQNSTIRTSIRRFLRQNRLESENLKAIIILKEIQGLFSRLITDRTRRIAYLQVSSNPSVPRQFMNRVGSSGCRLSLAYLNDNQYENAESLLDSFTEKGIREIAVNASFSPLKPHIEEELARSLEQRRPGTFRFITPEFEDYQPYLTKENKLLINTVLKGPLTRIWERISSALPGKALLFCCGDGSIRNLQTVTENPLLLWQSEKAQLLRGAVRTSGLNTFISLLPWGEEGLCLNMVRAGTPQTSTGSKLFSGLPIVLNTLQNTTSIKWPSSYKLRELFSTINPTQGPVEILNGTGNPLSSEFLSYRETPLIKSDRIHMLGMTRAPYCNRFFRLIKNQKRDSSRGVEREMIARSLREESKLGLELYSRKNEFKLTSLKYMKSGRGMLYLDTRGYLV
jgi:hypothetical protein